MDEYEQLQRFFIEKQKENLRLKQELNNIKEKLSDDNSEFSRLSDKHKEETKENKESTKDKDFSPEKDLETSPDKSKSVSPEINIKRDSYRKDTGNNYLNREMISNSSFLSNDYKLNRKCFKPLNYKTNNFKRATVLVDGLLNRNSIDINNNLNLSKIPSQLFNLKPDISSIKLSGTPLQNQLKAQIINNSVINGNNFNLDSDTNINLHNHIKSSTNLPHFTRNSIFNTTEFQRANDNYLNNNYTRFNLAETPNVDLNEINHNVSAIGEGKSIYLNVGRLYEDKEADRSKSPIFVNPNNASTLSTNKGVIKNLETNICELKNQLKSYENAYESISSRLENNQDNSKVLQLEAKINELNNLLSLKEEEKKHIQELYTKEMKAKLELHNLMILNMKNAQSEEIKNIKGESENFIQNIQKQFDEEKIELKNKIMNLEKELIMMNKKNDANEKAEIMEFQNKYLIEMRELQNSFENFKEKTYQEMKILRKQKEDANKKANMFQQNLENVKANWEQNECIYRENYRNMKNKLDSFKIFIKNNEILKNQLELSKAEISFLKLKVSKLESSEKNLHNILLEKSLINSNVNQNFSCANNISDGFYPGDTNYFSNRSNVDYTNYDFQLHFQGSDTPYESQVYNKQIKRTYNRSASSHQRHNGQSNNLSLRDSDLKKFEENSNKIMDFEFAQMKILQMENYLKSMYEENEILKGKLGNINRNSAITEDTYKSNTRTNDIQNNAHSREKSKKRISSSAIKKKTLDDLDEKNKDITQKYNPSQMIPHYKANLMETNEIDENENNNFIDDTKMCIDINNGYFNKNPNYPFIKDELIQESIRTKEKTANLIKWNRNLTLGKGSQNNLIVSSEDPSINNFKDENHIGYLDNDAHEIDDTSNTNINKISPFLYNSATFLPNDYENINDKISNLGNIDDTNNLEETEQIVNEEDSDNYNVVEFPLQIKNKNKKKVNKMK